jgi:hypothetical protein
MEARTHLVCINRAWIGLDIWISTLTIRIDDGDVDDVEEETELAGPWTVVVDSRDAGVRWSIPFLRPR